MPDRPTNREIWFAFIGRPYRKIMTPHNTMSGREVRELIAHELGVPPTVICVYHDNQLVTSHEKITLYQGAFLRAELGLAGGNKTPKTDSLRSWGTPPLRCHNRPLIDTPKPMKNNEPTTKLRKINWHWATTLTKPKRKIHTLTPRPSQHSWTIPQKTHHKKEHMINGNPEEDRTTWSKPEMEEQDKSKIHSCTGMEKVYRDWKSMLQLARQFEIFRLPPKTTQQAANRLARLIETTAELDKPAIETLSTAICLVSLENQPIFTAAMLGEEQTFKAHCLSAIASKATGAPP